MSETITTTPEVILLCRIKLLKAKENAEYNLNDLQKHHYPTDDLMNVIDKIDQALEILLTLLEPTALNGGGAVSQPNETKTNKYQQNKNNT